jgi:hypothetical protein
MVLNRAFLACYSKPRSVVKNLNIGLSKLNKMKWYKGKRLIDKQTLGGTHKVLKIRLKRKRPKLKKKRQKLSQTKNKVKKKKKKNGKSRKGKKRNKFKVLLSKGNSFDVPSTVKQIN